MRGYAFARLVDFEMKYLIPFLFFSVLWVFVGCRTMHESDSFDAKAVAAELAKDNIQSLKIVVLSAIRSTQGVKVIGYIENTSPDRFARIRKAYLQDYYYVEESCGDGTKWKYVDLDLRSDNPKMALYWEEFVFVRRDGEWFDASLCGPIGDSWRGESIPPKAKIPFFLKFSAGLLLTDKGCISSEEWIFSQGEYFKLRYPHADLAELAGNIPFLESNEFEVKDAGAGSD